MSHILTCINSSRRSASKLHDYQSHYHPHAARQPHHELLISGVVPRVGGGGGHRHTEANINRSKENITLKLIINPTLQEFMSKDEPQENRQA